MYKHSGFFWQGNEMCASRSGSRRWKLINLLTAEVTTCQQAPQVPSKHIQKRWREEKGERMWQSNTNSRQANYVGNLKRALKSRQHFK